MSLTAIIVDDEPLLAEYLQAKLTLLWPELEIIALAHSGKQALKLVESMPPNIAFIDIHMPEMTGLELAAELPEKTKIVFVTAFDRYAVEAFQRAAVDYLLKPVTAERLRITIDRLKVSPVQSRDELVELIASLNPQPKSYLQWLKAGVGEATTLIAAADVIYFKSSQKYTEVHTSAKTYLIRPSITELEASLDPSEFWRIHRSVVVRVDQIEMATKDFGGRYNIKLKGRKEKLVCSKSYNHLFRQT